jgi:hypothetical protein
MLGLLRYATARPRLAASIAGQLGRDVGLAESGSPRVKRDALLTPRDALFTAKRARHDYCERSDNSRSSSARPVHPGAPGLLFIAYSQSATKKGPDFCGDTVVETGIAGGDLRGFLQAVRQDEPVTSNFFL